MMAGIPTVDSKQRMIENQIVNALEALINELRPLWVELYGDNENVFSERCESIVAAVQSVFNEMVKEEMDNKAEYEEQYDALLNEARNLEEELNVRVNREELVDNRDPLCVKIQIWESKLQEYRTMREERLVQLKNLQDKESRLCQVLEETPQYGDIESVPSQDLLNQISSHVQRQGEKLLNRKETYHQKRKKIMELWTSLQVEPTTAFEIKLFQNELTDTMGLATLQQVSDLLTKMMTLKHDMDAELNNLKAALNVLWHRLQTDSKHKETFLRKYTHLCTETIHAFKKEIEICTTLKLERMQEIVTTIRTELTSWWDRCHFGDEQRKEFAPFYETAHITEDILVAHEAEVEKMKNYFNQYKEFLELIQHRMTLWDKMVGLEKNANDKDRLFKNRGGQLLQEERERKIVSKELPKIEKILEKLFDKYEKEQGVPFLYDGINVRALFVEQWMHKNQEKENSKNTKKQLGTSQASKSKLISPANAHITPRRNVTIKRRLEATPSRDINKRSRSVDPRRRLQAPTCCTPGSGNITPPEKDEVNYFSFQRNITMRKRSTSISDLPLASDKDESKSLSSVLKPTPNSSINVEDRSISNVLVTSGSQTEAE